MPGFYMKRNTRLKWVNIFEFCKGIFRTFSNIYNVAILPKELTA